MSGLTASLLAVGLVGAVTVETPRTGHVVVASAPRDTTSAFGSAETGDTETTPATDLTTTTTAAASSPTTARPQTATTTAPAAVTTHQPASLQSGIYVVDADGGTPRRIVAGTGIHRLSFSPDGKRVTYMVKNQVWSVPATGGAAAPLTPESAFMVEATWSSSGRFLAYGSSDDAAKPAHLMLLEVATGETRDLGELNWSEGSVAWQKHADVLVFSNFKTLVVHNALTRESFPVFPEPAAFAPFAWSDDGDELAYRSQNDLAVFTFTDTNHYTTDRPKRIVATSSGPKDPVWIGDQIYFVNPWKLDVAAAPGGNQRNVVSGYTGSLRVAAKNSTTLFLSIGADAGNVANRRIERVALDGSDRRVIVNPIARHQIQDYAVSPQGDTVAFWAVGE